MAVDHHRKRHAIQTRYDTAIKFGRAPIDRDRMALRRISDTLRPLIEHVTQHNAPVIGRATDQEICRRWPPSAGQPINIGLKSTRSQYQRPPGNLMDFITNLHLKAFEPIARQMNVAHFGIVMHLNSKIFGGIVIGIHQRFAAAQKKGIRAPQRQRARQRWLEPHTMRLHPRQTVLAVTNGQAGQCFIGLAFGHQQKILIVFFFFIAIDQHRKWAMMHAAKIARVARIPPTIGFGGTFQHNDPCPCLGRLDSGT